jgi:poly(3-hydroxybutyrate) depolymerase
MLFPPLISLLLAFAQSPGCVTNTNPGDHTFNCEKLAVYTHVPTNCPSLGCGLILELHGDGGTGPAQDAHWKLGELGEKSGYILIAPSGIGFPPTDDALVKITRQFQQAFKADSRKIHVTGFSRGGFAVWRLACDHADIFASVAPAAAGEALPNERSCFSNGSMPSRRLPVLMMIGLEDRNVPVPTQTAMRDLVISRWQLSGPQKISGDEKYAHNRWTGADGAVFEDFEHHYELSRGGGHCVPGSPPIVNSSYDYACAGPNAFVWGEEVMKFFIAHPMPLQVPVKGAASTTSRTTGVVSGRVFSTSGKPAANVRVSLSVTNDGGELMGITQTDRAGRYRIEDVPAGSYYVLAGLVSSPTYFPGSRRPGEAIAISLQARSVIELPDFQLQDASGGLRVRGRLVREGIPDSQATPPLTVRIMRTNESGGRRVPSSSYRTFSANVAPDGTFEFPEVPSGEYLLTFSPNIVGGNQQLVLDRDLENLQLTLPYTAWAPTLEATVRIRGVAPLPTIGIRLTNINRSGWSPSSLWRFVGEAFSMPLVRVGEYSVDVTGLPPGYSIQSMTSGETNLLSENLKVNPVGIPKIVLVLDVASPLPGVSVIGRITRQGDIRLPGEIEISRETPRLTMFAPILPDGSFEFLNVPAGTFNVELHPTPVRSIVESRTVVVGKENPTRVEIPLSVSGR